MTEIIRTGKVPDEDTAEKPGLSQLERVADAYVAPCSLFADIAHKSASWWLPFVIGAVVGLAFVYTIDRQIGFEKVAEATISASASAQEQMGSLSDSQREHAMHAVATTTKTISYAFPVLTLFFALVAAGILMASFNVGLGANVKYQQLLAVWMYSSLPLAIKYLLAAIVIFAGAGADQFNMQNPVGTNIGWYLSPDLPLWLRTLMQSADVFTIWVVVLLIFGCATVARVKRSSAAYVVVGWWVLAIFGSTVAAALRG